MGHRTLRIAGAGALGVLLSLGLAGPASAAVTLADGVVQTTGSGETYAFKTVTNYWSVVAIQPRAGDVDLTLKTPAGTALRTSTWGTNRTDFVAIDSNAGRRPLQNYEAQVTLFSGSVAHAAQQQQGHTTTTLPTPAYDGVSGPSDPDITFAVLSNPDVVSVADIYLTAGQKFWATTTVAGQSLYLAESNPADSTTYLRSRSEAGAALHTIVDGCTLYTATYTGWHGLVVVADRFPTSPGAGIAYALHRFNPARPTTCPVKNFPDPTPA